MRRLNRRPAFFTAVCGVMGLALLAGCATRQTGLSSTDEASRYLQTARGRYAIPGTAGDPWGPYIKEASNRFDMPETWIRALMRQESGGNLYRGGRLITSSAGAMGLMQVMPGTYRELRARHALGADPFDPRDNIMAGVAYMREMYDIYGAPGFLAAYNAGPNRLDDYLANMRGLPDETRKYVASIGPSLRHATPRVHSPAQQFAMNQLPLYIPPGPRFGYGSTQPANVQVAYARPTVVTPTAFPVAMAAAQPAAPRPVAVAWAETPPRPAPVSRPVGWEQPPAAVAYAPAAVAAPRVVYAAAPVQRTRTVIITQYEPAPEPPVRTAASSRREAAPQRLALGAPPRHGGGFRLISSAMASESIGPRRSGRSVLPASYLRAEPRTDRTRAHESRARAPAWKLRVSGLAHASPATSGSCHKGHGKSGCGLRR